MRFSIALHLDEFRDRLRSGMPPRFLYLQTAKATIAAPDRAPVAHVSETTCSRSTAWNVAHGVGWLLGLLTAVVITGGLRLGRPRTSIRLFAMAAIVVVMAASLAGASKFRHYVNFAENGGADQARLASQAFEECHFDVAIDRYRAAIAISPHFASTWYNLGVAYSRKGDSRRALTRAV